GYLGHLELEARGALGLVPDLLQRAMEGNTAHVDVVDQEILAERLAVSDHVAARVEDDAVAVEDKLVLPADGVHVSDVGAVVDGAPAHHLLTRPALALVIRGAVDVDQQLDPMLGLP